MPEAGPEGDGQVPPLTKINIVEQIEYYFGDFNMMKDKFMRAEVQKNEGWIPIKTMLRFNRLAALTKDPNVILSSFKENPSSIVEVDVANQSIRRNPDREIPQAGENWRNVVAERTIYAKGFPAESTTLDDILKFMQTFGKIDNVFKRSYFDKALKKWVFKGSVFVTFPTKDDAAKFMDIKSVKFAGNELIRKWQNDYNEEKKTERAQNKLKAKEMKDKLLKDQAQSELKTESKLPTGALIHLSGLVNAISVGALKNKFKEFEWNVAFVDYSPGESEAYVRLQDANTAKEALTKLTDNTFEIQKTTVKAELVEGEKETEQLQKMEADRNSRVLHNFMKHKKGGKKNKGHHRQKGKKGAAHDDDKMDQSETNADKKNGDEPKPSTSDNLNGNSAESSSLKRKPDEQADDNSEAAKKVKSED